jgi:hypothetical protein
MVAKGLVMGMVFLLAMVMVFSCGVIDDPGFFP